MKTDMNCVWDNLLYLFNSQLNIDAKNWSKALQRRYLRNKSLWWPFLTHHQLLSAMRNTTTYNCKVKHSQVLSGAYCPAAIFNSFRLLITFAEYFKYNMVKQSKLHFWSSTEDFLTEKGQNCLSQWSCIEGSIFICAYTISISSRYSREITQTFLSYKDKTPCSDNKAFIRGVSATHWNLYFCKHNRTNGNSWRKSDF